MRVLPDETTFSRNATLANTTRRTTIAGRIVYPVIVFWRDLICGAGMRSDVFNRLEHLGNELCSGPNESIPHADRTNLDDSGLSLKVITQ